MIEQRSQATANPKILPPHPLALKPLQQRSITYQVLDKAQLKHLAQDPARQGVGLVADNHPPLNRERKVSHPALQVHPCPSRTHPRYLEELCPHWTAVWLKLLLHEAAQTWLSPASSPQLLLVSGPAAPHCADELLAPLTSGAALCALLWGLLGVSTQPGALFKGG